MAGMTQAVVTTCNFSKVPESITIEHPESYSQQHRRHVTHLKTKTLVDSSYYTEANKKDMSSVYSQEMFLP
jgi:hypothetical protein